MPPGTSRSFGGSGIAPRHSSASLGGVARTGTGTSTFCVTSLVTTCGWVAQAHSSSASRLVRMPDPIHPGVNLIGAVPLGCLWRHQGCRLSGFLGFPLVGIGLRLERLYSLILGFQSGLAVSHRRLGHRNLLLHGA